MDTAVMPCQALVRMLAKKPGWKETNFQVTVSLQQLIFQMNVALFAANSLSHCAEVVWSQIKAKKCDWQNNILS